MPWTDSFWKPIKLNDGRVPNTLGDARDFIAILPALKQAEGHWRDADEMLIRVAVAPSAINDALAAIVRALKMEGLIQTPSRLTLAHALVPRARYPDQT
jgi:hypothetical protein